MKTIKLYCVIEGGILASVYGDAMPQGYTLEIIVRDLDNIKDGDENPAPNSYANAQAFYY